MVSNPYPSESDLRDLSAVHARLATDGVLASANAPFTAVDR